MLHEALTDIRHAVRVVRRLYTFLDTLAPRPKSGAMGPIRRMASFANLTTSGTTRLDEDTAWENLRADMLLKTGEIWDSDED